MHERPATATAMVCVVVGAVNRRNGGMRQSRASALLSMEGATLALVEPEARGSGHGDEPQRRAETRAGVTGHRMRDLRRRPCSPCSASSPSLGRRGSGGRRRLLHRRGRQTRGRLVGRGAGRGAPLHLDRLALQRRRVAGKFVAIKQPRGQIPPCAARRRWSSMRGVAGQPRARFGRRSRRPLAGGLPRDLARRRGRGRVRELQRPDDPRRVGLLSRPRGPADQADHRGTPTSPTTAGWTLRDRTPVRPVLSELQ